MNIEQNNMEIAYSLQSYSFTKKKNSVLLKVKHLKLVIKSIKTYTFL